ncbi:PAS domain-containing sensor histidine kinase [Massilia sp. AB1]|uniref:sensor histidine kinase n=1 Tax=Massilia sp. AB1 TaxID=2823371 RepID=UPI001B837DE4|nr:PAS domain-containing sensor histidine kinase [Massilia sp. AB1]MBQ5941154.1 PAS domain S-box protein [Massilia sp. AB1]
MPLIHSKGTSAHDDMRFRELFEQARVSIQILSPSGLTLCVNKAWEELWHIREGSEVYAYVLSEAYNILHDPQLHATGIAPYLERALAGELVEIPAIRYDTAELGYPGPARWVTARAHPIKDTDGRLLEVMLMHEDITKRVEAETALRQREERFRSLVMATTHMVWTTAGDGRVIDDMPSWRAYTGQSREQTRDFGWLDALHPDDREHTSRKWNECLAAKSVFVGDYRVRRADGEYRWTAVKAVPILNEDGEVREWIGTNTDIDDAVAERAELAQRLHRERRQSALLAKVARASQNLHAALSSEDIADTLALEVRDILGVRHAEVKLGAEDAAVDFERSRLSVPLVSRKGGRIGLIHASDKIEGEFSDEDEAILVQLAAIAANGFENARLYASLREQDRRKDEFLAMLAHELRNPLAPISAAAEVLKLAASDAYVRRSSEVIGRQVRHLTALVDDLLDVSRVTRGLIELDRKVLDIESVVASAIEQARPLLETRRHRFELALEAGAARVLGDATRLVQVLTNLLNNAAKYTPPGGHVRLTVARAGSGINLQVSDDGIGIEPGLLPHVFDLFTQAERTPDRSQGGLGIGLALVRNMVALHGGDVEARSAGAGQGSTFTVWLPAV